MPTAVTCHICGRDFGTASIAIHQRQCAKKWEQQELLKPPKDRRPVPEAPEVDPSVSPSKYNDAAFQKWNSEVLQACENCGRTFLPDRLEVHLRSCKPKPGAPRPPPPTAAAPAAVPKGSQPTSPQPARPHTVVCHICGREFGSASIDIHIPQCEKKWLAQEELKPPKLRRPVPTAPEQALNADGKPLRREEYNEAALQKWNDEALLACPNCGRTFLPDRLEIHLRSCKSKDGSSRAVAAPTPPPKAPRPASPPPSRPATVVCHICGREFGTSSIDIHIPQCEKKWEQREALKAPKDRRPVPRAPEGEGEVQMTKEEYNAAAMEKWRTEALMACPHCGRTFLPDRLEVHLRSCAPAHGSSLKAPGPHPAPAPSESTAPAEVYRPRSVVCHICGREFGTSSIDIHLPQCKKKWEAQEALKPPKQRRPVPTAPEESAGMNQEDYNKAALKAWNNKALLACPNCGRTFLPDRLEIHLRSCRPKDDGPKARAVQPSPPPEQQVPPQLSSPSRPNSVVCHICGREFGTASIDIHVPQCQKKWEAQEMQKPPAERRPVPEAPDVDPVADRGAFNEAALKKWNEEALMACPTCGRTFLPDRLEVHLRSCRPKEGTALTASPGRSPSAPPPPGAEEGPDSPATSPARPRSARTPARGDSGATMPKGPTAPTDTGGGRPRLKTVVCYICGREFGATSIDIHVPQCLRKWEAQEAQKPPSERRPPPASPTREPGMTQEEYNDAARKAWNEEVLVRCENCGRTFLPDRLEVHQRSCRPRPEDLPN